jgi:hypothetical protein
MAGIVMLYIGLLYLSLIAEQNASVNSSSMNLFNQLLTPTGTDFSNPLAATVSLATDVWQYFKLVFQIVFLWFPDLWVGNWIWFYLFVCFPITVMMAVTFITILRGSFVS